MKEEDRLQELFSGFSPELGDSSEYMEAISRKLEKVEYLKKLRDADRKRQRSLLLTVFISGMVCGGGILAYLVSGQASSAQIPFLFALGGIKVMPELIMLVSFSIAVVCASVLVVRTLQEAEE